MVMTIYLYDVILVWRGYGNLTDGRNLCGINCLYANDSIVTANWWFATNSDAIYIFDNTEWILIEWLSYGYLYDITRPGLNTLGIYALISVIQVQWNIAT